MQAKKLTTNEGVPVFNNQDFLTVGERGPVLLQEVHFIEKMAHFDRERIPERVVHAKGAGAHGYFQVYKNMALYTKAKFLQDPKNVQKGVVLI
jgi:catalase